MRAAMRAALLAVAAGAALDSYYPIFHARPATGWVNDPNAPFWQRLADRLRCLRGSPQEGRKRKGPPTHLASVLPPP